MWLRQLNIELEPQFLENGWGKKINIQWIKSNKLAKKYAARMVLISVLRTEIQ